VRISLTDDAGGDLEDIFAFSERQWGHEQAERYQSHLLSTLELLSEQPHLGSRIPEMSREVRVLRINQHNALYSIEADRILVLRLFHIRRQLPTPE
jgi:plasmid stabilization system protein ParE